MRSRSLCWFAVESRMNEWMCRDKEFFVSRWFESVFNMSSDLWMCSFVVFSDWMLNDAVVWQWGVVVLRLLCCLVSAGLGVAGGLVVAMLSLFVVDRSPLPFPYFFMLLFYCLCLRESSPYDDDVFSLSLHLRFRGLIHFLPLSLPQHGWSCFGHFDNFHQQWIYEISPVASVFSPFPCVYDLNGLRCIKCHKLITQNVHIRCVVGDTLTFRIPHRVSYSFYISPAHIQRVSIYD